MTAVYESGADLSDALRLAHGFHAGSVWSEVTLDEPAVSGFLANLAASEDGFVAVTPTGVVGGLVMPLWFAPSIKLGVELFWYSEQPGEGQRLRAAYERWARGREAHTIQFSCMLNDREPALRRMYRAAGFDAIEIGFRKVV